MLSIDKADFSARLKAIKQLEDPSELLHEVSELAQHRLDFLQVIQLARFAESNTIPLTPINIAILSSNTCDHLAAGIRVAGLKHKLLINVWHGQYGLYRQEIMTPDAALKEFNPDYILFSFSASHLYSDIALHTAPDAVQQKLTEAVAEISNLWRMAIDQFDCSVIQQTCLNINEPLFGNYDRQVATSPFQLTQQINSELARQATTHNVGLLDIARHSAKDGYSHWFDPARWLQAKMEVAPTAVLDYGHALANYLTAHRGQSRKCLVMDLDNTLWGGVIGDDGVDGIVLGQGSGAGEAFIALQRYAKQLNERGIVLAVCSKNELANAQAPFLEHPDMLLKLDDIAVFVANWNDKAANLQSIAKQLNIGLDSLVFIDDNPAERDRVKEALPMVAVPYLPEDPAAYVSCLANHGYFEAIAFTNEDRQRADQYKANAQRVELESSAVSMDSYLAGLKMELSYGPISKLDLQRATQLIGKTNQFNTTTIRYTLEQVSNFSNDANSVTLQCRLADKFGDNGLVSVMLLSPDNELANTIVLHNWVMSCRVFGRQLERELMNILIEQLTNRDIDNLVAEFIPSPKNKVIESIFSDFGFTLDTETDIEKQRWQLPISNYQQVTTHISRKAPE